MQTKSTAKTKSTTKMQTKMQTKSAAKSRRKSKKEPEFIGGLPVRDCKLMTIATVRNFPVCGPDFIRDEFKAMPPRRLEKVIKGMVYGVEAWFKKRYGGGFPKFRRYRCCSAPDRRLFGHFLHS